MQEIPARIDAAANATDPDRQAALELSALFRPGDPGALSDALVQAFVRTELCAAGLITLGQHIELQVELRKPET